MGIEGKLLVSRKNIVVNKESIGIDNDLTQDRNMNTFKTYCKRRKSGARFPDRKANHRLCVRVIALLAMRKRGRKRERKREREKEREKEIEKGRERERERERDSDRDEEREREGERKREREREKDREREIERERGREGESEMEI